MFDFDMERLERDFRTEPQLETVTGTIGMATSIMTYINIGMRSENPMAPITNPDAMLAICYLLADGMGTQAHIETEMPPTDEDLRKGATTLGDAIYALAKIIRDQEVMSGPKQG